jgi:hypothetical protein
MINKYIIILTSKVVYFILLIPLFKINIRS